MAWMSINQWKKKYGIGLANEEGGVLYKEFFFLKMGSSKLIFEAKKRYVRILSEPAEAMAAFKISRASAKDLARALAVQAELPTAEQQKGRPEKDSLGFKVYGAFKDAMGVSIQVREVDTRYISIVVEGIPHLSTSEVSDLIKALTLFVGDKK